jgi:putative spermidine/putrescine transport system permease protein
MTAQAALPARVHSNIRYRDRRRAWIRFCLLGPAVALVILLFVVPLLIYFHYSWYTFSAGQLSSKASASSFTAVLEGAYYHHILWQTVEMAVYTTVISVALAYPLAYAMWRAKSSALRFSLGITVFMPLTISTVVRSYAWQTLLSKGSIVQEAMNALGFGSSSLIFNMNGVIISLVQIFLPFMVFPIYNSLSRIDPSLSEAAADLGASWRRIFRTVTLPLSMPGVLAGTELTLALAIGAYVTPSLLGGGRVSVLPLDIYNNTTQIDWPLAAVESIELLALAMLALLLCRPAIRILQRRNAA